MQQLTLQNLSDSALISDQLYRYAKGLDTCDWDLVASVLTDPFHLKAEMLDVDRTISPREYIELAPGKSSDIDVMLQSFCDEILK